MLGVGNGKVYERTSRQVGDEQDEKTKKTGHPEGRKGDGGHGGALFLFWGGCLPGLFVFFLRNGERMLGDDSRLAAARRTRPDQASKGGDKRRWARMRTKEEKAGAPQGPGAAGLLLRAESASVDSHCNMDCAALCRCDGNQSMGGALAVAPAPASAGERSPGVISCERGTMGQIQSLPTPCYLWTSTIGAFCPIFRGTTRWLACTPYLFELSSCARTGCQGERSDGGVPAAQGGSTQAKCRSRASSDTV